MIETPSGAPGAAAFDPVAIRREVGALGSDVTPEIMERSRARYARFHESEPYEGVTVLRDLSYGPHPRQRLDLFAAAPAPGGVDRQRQVLVFLHGGGFVAGDKYRPGTPYHDNVALWAVHHGYLGVNMTYRLAPESHWPSGSEDIAAVLHWLRASGPEHGAAADRVVLLGTSAGAAHIASFLSSPSSDAEAATVAGAVLVAGAYDFTTFENEGLHDYLGTDRSLDGERSPLAGLLSTPVPTLFVLGEFEPEQAERQTFELISAHSRRHGRWPKFVRLLGHNHFTATDHLNTPDDSLGQQLQLFLSGLVGDGSSNE